MPKKASIDGCPTQSPNKDQNGWFSKWQVFELRILVPVCLGTRLGASKKGVFLKAHRVEILLEILGIPEIPRTAENKGESDHFLENLVS